MSKTCIIICGPTASGKTALSLRLAEYYKTAILSFDSRQCFRELNIGVAKPTPDELCRIQHYFINSHSILDNVTAAFFEKYGLEVLDNIFNSNDVAVLVGGTGLYLRALLEGLDEIPATCAEVRSQVNLIFETESIEGLKTRIKAADPVFYSMGDINNPRRIMRALEVCLQSGKPYSSFIKAQKKGRYFNSVLIAPDLPRAELYNRIDKRVEIMVSAGLKEEAASLIQYRNFPSLLTVGYSEWFNHFDGIFTEEKAIEEIKKNSRHYAKRQLTWFRKQDGIHWIPPGKDVVELCNDLLKLNP